MVPTTEMMVGALFFGMSAYIACGIAHNQKNFPWMKALPVALAAVAVSFILDATQVAAHLTLGFQLIILIQLVFASVTLVDAIAFGDIRKAAVTGAFSLLLPFGALMFMGVIAGFLQFVFS